MADPLESLVQLHGAETIAAVIVEANGANGGIFPLQNPVFLEDLRCGDFAPAGHRLALIAQIGRASCRERV